MAKVSERIDSTVKNYIRDVNKHIVYGAMRANKLSTNSSPSNTPSLLLLLSSLRKALILRRRRFVRKVAVSP